MVDKRAEGLGEGYWRRRWARTKELQITGQSVTNNTQSYFRMAQTSLQSGPISWSFYYRLPSYMYTYLPACFLHSWTGLTVLYEAIASNAREKAHVLYKNITIHRKYVILGHFCKYLTEMLVFNCLKIKISSFYSH